MPAKFRHTADQAALWPVYRDNWIRIAMRTDPMTEEDRRICAEAATQLYEFAGKPAPRVIFVPSPLAGAMVAGCSAWMLHCRQNGSHANTADAATRDAICAATRDATYDATDAATYNATRAAASAATRAATRDATYDATYAATRDATSAATRAATDAATYAATYAAADAATYVATYDATYDATRAAAYAATYAATRAATRPKSNQDLTQWYTTPVDIREICARIAGEGGVRCAHEAYLFLQGGNQWAGVASSLEWFREVARLDIDWSKWMPWVTLAEHSGPRYVHEEFVVISDFPTVLRVDNNNRPHCSTGPFCQWADGFSLYAWHGIRVPAWVIETPQEITIEKIDAETNAEIRRVMIDRYGFAPYLDQKGAALVDEDVDEGGEPMRLLSMATDDDDGQPMRVIYLRNSTADPDGSRREYIMRVPPTAQTVWEARNSTFALPPEARFDAVS